MCLSHIIRVWIIAAISIIAAPAIGSETKAREMVEGYEGYVAFGWISRYYAAVVPRHKRPHLKVLEMLQRRGVVSKYENGGPWTFDIQPEYRSLVLSKPQGWFQFKLGTYEDIVVISVERSTRERCDMSVRARAWLSAEEITGEVIRAYTRNDWIMQDFCFIYGRNGLELSYIDLVF